MDPTSRVSVIEKNSKRGKEMLKYYRKRNFPKLFGTLWTVALQALSIEFSRQEHWSGLPCLSAGDLPSPEF